MALRRPFKSPMLAKPFKPPGARALGAAAEAQPSVAACVAQPLDSSGSAAGAPPCLTDKENVAPPRPVPGVQPSVAPASATKAVVAGAPALASADSEHSGPCPCPCPLHSLSSQYVGCPWGLCETALLPLASPWYRQWPNIQHP